MSSAPLPHQHINDTSATDGSLAIAGAVHGNVTFYARECQCTKLLSSLQSRKLILYLVSSPQAPPKPSSTVPFRRDPDFVDRGDLLSQVDERCSQPAGRAALVGLGGVGKSQLAIEYTHRTRERSPDTWVFWVHASNAARFEQDYQDIADVIKIAGREDPQADIFKLVHDWLRGCEGKWLMILDNVDNSRFLLEAKAKSQSQITQPDNGAFRSLWEYLPKSPNGSILITSRSKEAALELVKVNETISVEPMSETHATELCKKKLGPEVLQIDEDIAKLVAVLEFMPLAVAQAAAYISQRAPRYSVREYIRKFQKSDQSKSNLLDSDDGHFHTDGEVKKSIVRTWQISFEHILQARPSATNLLSLMSFFDSQGISEALVRNRSRTGEAQGNTNDKEGDDASDDESSASDSEDDGFDDDISTLRNYYFVSIRKDAHVYEMHKLVQLATRKWLEANEQLEEWKEQYIKILYEEVPNGEYENWTYCRALFPHAKLAVTQRPKRDGSLKEWASLLHNAAWYAWRMGSITEAVNLSKITMKVRKKILGQEHKETLSSIGMVSLAYGLGGRWKEAEELEVQVMEIMKRVLGEEHPYTLINIANLASTYRSQGRWKEAEELEVQVIEIRKRVLGEEHPNTLTSIANLASIYRSQGRWKEAEELGVQVMEKTKRVLGEEHPDTLTSINNFAFTLKDKGEDEKAIALMEECVRKQKQVLGQDHPFTKGSEDTLSRWRMEGLHLGSLGKDVNGTAAGE